MQIRVNLAKAVGIPDIGIHLINRIIILKGSLQYKRTGSKSGVFQGISVFVGLIVSLGSSTVIGNIIAGLVITYMRPFKLGDRIKLNDTTGNIIEKTRRFPGRLPTWNPADKGKSWQS